MTHDRKIIFPHRKGLLIFINSFYQFHHKFINSFSSLFLWNPLSLLKLSILPFSYFYQFLLSIPLLFIFIHKFINCSFSLFLSIPPPPYFYQFLRFLIFMISFFTTNLSIIFLPYFYQFLHLLIKRNEYQHVSKGKSIDSTNILFHSIIILNLKTMNYEYIFKH